MSFEPTDADLNGHAYLALSDAAARLWLRAAHWCASGNSPVITATMLKAWLSSKKAAQELVAAGFWAPSGDDWVVPDRPESLSAKRARAGRAGGQASASKRASKTQANVSFASQANGQAKPDFASQANAVLVPPPPLASPSPSPQGNSGSSDLLSDLPSFQPLSGSNRSRARAAKPAPNRRMRRCPEGFELDEAGRKLCAELRVNWAVEGPKFRDWEFKDPKSDWQATARTWIRNAAGRSSSGAAAPVRNGYHAPENPNLEHDRLVALECSRRTAALMYGAK